MKLYRYYRNIVINVIVINGVECITFLDESNLKAESVNKLQLAPSIDSGDRWLWREADAAPQRVDSAVPAAESLETWLTSFVRSLTAEDTDQQESQSFSDCDSTKPSPHENITHPTASDSDEEAIHESIQGCQFLLIWMEFKNRTFLLLNWISLSYQENITAEKFSNIYFKKSYRNAMKANRNNF